MTYGAARAELITAAAEWWRALWTLDEADRRLEAAQVRRFLESLWELDQAPARVDVDPGDYL